MISCFTNIYNERSMICWSYKLSNQIDSVKFTLSRYIFSCKGWNVFIMSIHNKSNDDSWIYVCCKSWWKISKVKFNQIFPSLLFSWFDFFCVWKRNHFFHWISISLQKIIIVFIEIWLNLNEKMNTSLELQQ